MKHRIGIWVTVAILLATAPVTAATRYILRARALTIDGIASRHSLTIVRSLDSKDRGIFLVSRSDADALPELEAEVEAELEADADVLQCEPDGNASIPESSELLQSGLSQSTANILDSLSNRTMTNYFGSTAWVGYTRQPAAVLVRIAEAQALATGHGVIAVIDTGVDPLHPVLASSLVPGYDFIREIGGIPSEMSDLTPAMASILTQSTANILDGGAVKQINGSTAAILSQSTANILDTSQLPSAFGHGTMVAGVVHLVAPTSRIMPLKAFRADGTTDVFNILRAIYFAVDNGARVINMSFSLAGFSAELVRAVNYATGRGVICVSSVGNAGKETLVFPAAFQNVIGVASTSNLDVRSSFSNYGAALADMAAPGEAIITTYPGGKYAAAWGTSFSSPFVAGGASLLQQIKSGMGQTEAAQSLSNAKLVSGDLGYGRLDLYSALASRAKP